MSRLNFVQKETLWSLILYVVCGILQNFHIFSLSYNLTSDDLWPCYVTFEKKGMIFWQHPFLLKQYPKSLPQSVLIIIEGGKVQYITKLKEKILPGPQTFSVACRRGL